MTPDYVDLSELKRSIGYQKLQMLWAIEGKKIMDALNRATRERSKDESLRYHAGMWHGFDLAIGQLERALAEIQRQLGNAKEEISVEQLLKQVRGGDKT